ncbi:hypothetical protein BU14_0022s0100 [Porphyra umbilicalis]|uniref:Uncharacterized protein n=1 Tax=Porphyra umbilicalis TaxID=2786 RepID=A0A1X6PKM2_PORUM|nr:hypothetical protein BU14_0022s0100 [Porphyra umbilicalis]|eukprot:OSX81380.1 hypothetical protein BU14_0022s0100 [Porphyra umbilicalis]
MEGGGSEWLHRITIGWAVPGRPRHQTCGRRRARRAPRRRRAHTASCALPRRRAVNPRLPRVPPAPPPRPRAFPTPPPLWGVGGQPDGLAPAVASGGGPVAGTPRAGEPPPPRRRR